VRLVPDASSPLRYLDAEDLRSRVQKVLDDFLSEQEGRLEEVSPDCAPLVESVSALLRGGKRLRPAFCYWGWRGAGGPDDVPIVDVAASLELFQAAALIHDDVMDASDTRRGMPAVHRRFAMLHRGSGWTGDGERFGSAGAILSGDLCLCWSDDLLARSALPAARLAAGRAVYSRMRTELMGGQYLDMLEQTLPADAGEPAGTRVRRARAVIRFKSAKYSVEHPLLLGGTLAGAPPDLLASYSAFGLPLGEAFQLRDDVLGVFGDPRETGKPAGDDLREGKRTVLVAFALERASPAQAAAVRRLLGDPHLDAAGVATLREVLVDTGALARTEDLVTELVGRSLQALAGADVDEPARTVL
jgi:geranylgeranyl diphosphate synthase, type I